MFKCKDIVSLFSVTWIKPKRNMTDIFWLVHPKISYKQNFFKTMMFLFFQHSQDPRCLLLTLVWTACAQLHFTVSRTLLAMIASSSECSKNPTTLFPVIDNIVVLMVSYSTLRSVPGLAIWFLVVFFWGIKLLMPKKIHLEMLVALLKALYLKNAERQASKI